MGMRHMQAGLDVRLVSMYMMFVTDQLHLKIPARASDYLCVDAPRIPFI